MVIVKLSSLVFCATVFLVVCLAQLANGQDLLDSVVASVDGEPITFSQLRRYAASLGEKVIDESLPSASNPALSRLLREMVLTELLEKESTILGVGVSSEEVNAYLAEIKRQNNVDNNGLEELLKEKGMSLDDYKTQVRRDIIRTRVLGRTLRSKITISDEEIKRYIDENPSRKPADGSIHLHQFIVALSETEEDELAKEKQLALSFLNTVRDRINQGLSWKELTQSNYLDLGFVQSSDLRPEFNQVIRDLSVGKASNPIEIDNALVVLFMSSKVEGSELGRSFLDEMRSEIFDVRYKAELDKFLNDELPKKYLVEFKI